MKKILENLDWKTCHITTMSFKFTNAKILEITDGFMLIETEDNEKVIINLNVVRTVVEAKEGKEHPVFVPHDL